MNEQKIKEVPKPSAPVEESVFYKAFQDCLYPKLDVPDFNANNYRINKIMMSYKYLDDERKQRNALKKKYLKLKHAIFGVECFLTLGEIGSGAASIAFPPLLPIGIPLSLGMTTSAAILRGSGNHILNKVNKHTAIELLAKAKLDSIEEKYSKAIADGSINEEEFNSIEQERSNYDSLKERVLMEFGANKGSTDLHNNVRISLIEEGKNQAKKELEEALLRSIKGYK